jgi:GNAT superfamily N-acetyltransferase
MEIKFRKFTKSDIEVLIDFQKRLAWESEGITLNDSILRKGIDSMLADLNKGVYYVAEFEQQIVGCHMITYEWSDWRNGWTFWLQSVYVIEGFRKHGVFRKMYENLKTLALNDAGVAGIRLYVDKSNTRAQQVYASMGMDGSHYTVFEWMKPV